MKSRIILLFILLVILGGCSSENEKKVFSLLNNQITRQNECNQNNQALTDLMSEESNIYNNIIDKGLSDRNEAQGLIEEGYKNVLDSERYLEEYQTCVLNQQVDQDELKEINDNIEDETIREDTAQLIEQYMNYEQSLILYVEALTDLNDTQKSFYEELKTNSNTDELNQLISEINVAIENANTTSILHQEALDLFNTTYNDYYELYIK